MSNTPCMYNVQHTGAPHKRSAMEEAFARMDQLGRSYAEAWNQGIRPGSIKLGVKVSAMSHMMNTASLYDALTTPTEEAS